MQPPAVAHETPEKAAKVPGLGLGAIAHELPFHASTRVATPDADVPERTPEPPTAMHDTDDAHDTPLSPSSTPTLGLGTVVQFEPLHDSMSVRTEVLDARLPTATHLVTERHVTAPSEARPPVADPVAVDQEPPS
jgi:hypothetical protein